jgi:hypothetical protein
MCKYMCVQYNWHSHVLASQRKISMYTGMDWIFLNVHTRTYVPTAVPS